MQGKVETRAGQVSWLGRGCGLWSRLVAGEADPEASQVHSTGKGEDRGQVGKGHSDKKHHHPLSRGGPGRQARTHVPVCPEHGWQGLLHSPGLG